MRRSATLVLAAALPLALAIAGCSLDWFPADESKPEVRLAFPHAPHMEGGLACVDCHAADKATGGYSRTSLASCTDCHDDEGKEPEKRIDRFFENGTAKGPFFTALDDEVIFDHASHEAAGVKCDSCHGDLAKSQSLGLEMAIDMARCMTCHAERRAPNECATCHTEIRRDRMPPSHDAFFTKAHGTAARSTEDAAQCSLCHEESSCSTCHAVMMPQSHDNQFRRRGHGCLAALDRSACQTCHQSDFCIRCHQDTRPTSHTAAFGGTQSRHCYSCHLPVSSEPGCSVCHRGTPSHSLASPKPPDHTPGMNCRQCHGLTAPLPHVDNGDDCNTCHR